MRGDLVVELRELRVAVQRAVHKADTGLKLEADAELRAIRDQLADAHRRVGALIEPS
jgi:hypothetical protein